jgi:hypothetical protein
VDAVKTFDLRLRDSNNVSPGLYSTLAAGPQQVYGTPLSWEYILLLSDVQGIKTNLSSFISTSYITLSSDTAYISTYIKTNISTLSSILYKDYLSIEEANIYLNATLLYEVSNFFQETNYMPYPEYSLDLSTLFISTPSSYIYTFSTIYNLPYPNITTIRDTSSTISSYIKNVISSLAASSSLSTFFSYQLSTANQTYPFIKPSISTISSLNMFYSTSLNIYLLSDLSFVQSTTSTSIFNFFRNNSSYFYTFNSTLSNTSSYVGTAYSTQYITYSTVNGQFLGNQVSTTQQQFSTFSTVLGIQFSTVNYLYAGVILSTLSASQAGLTASINANFSTLKSSFGEVYRNISSILSTTVITVNNNNNNVNQINASQNSYIQGISTNIALLYYYNTINRPQTFFEVDFNYNGAFVSCNYYLSSLNVASLGTEQTNALSYLQTLYYANSTNTGLLYQSNVTNAYYNIIKVYRSCNIPLIDALCNFVFDPVFISKFGYPSSLSTAFGNYSTQVNSTLMQNYRLVTLSERLQILNTCNINSFSLSSYSLPVLSTATGQAYTSLSNEMRLLTSTNLVNLITNTFVSYRSNSELTLRIIDNQVIYNNIVMSNGNQNIIDHTIQDAFYRNLSTLFDYDFSTAKSVITSTSLNLINVDNTFTRFLPISTFSTYLYELSSLSTITFNKSIYSTITFNLSTLSTNNIGNSNRYNYSTFSTVYFNLSSYSTVNYNLSTYSTIFLNSTINQINYSNLSTFISAQLTYLPVTASTISTYLTKNVYSSLSSYTSIQNSNLCNFILSTCNSLNSQITTLSNLIFTYNAGQALSTTFFISQCNSSASFILSTTYANSISLKQNQLILSTFTTLSSIYINNQVTTFEAAANLRTNSNSPMKINFYDNKGYHNLLYVNPTRNEVIMNSLVIKALNRVTFSNTISTLSLDLNQYQNFYINIENMSNANPTIELTVNVSTMSKYTQEGYINVNLNTASANEIASGKFLNITNLGPTIRLNITRLAGYLRYKYLSIGGQVFISQSNDFTTTLSTTIPAGNVTTIANTSADFVGIVTDTIGNFFVTDINTNSVFKYNITTSQLSVFASGFNIPYNLTIDSNNNLYVTSFSDNSVYIIDSTGAKSLFIIIPQPVGIVIDSTGKYLYVSSLLTHAIYRIDLTVTPKIATLFAGTGMAGFADGTGTSASFGLVFGMSIDSTQNLYVTDYVNNSIRKINLISAQVETIAGNKLGLAGTTIQYPIGSVEDAFGTLALFNGPTGIIADNLGNLFVCDSKNFAIRLISLTTYQITTISGGLSKGTIDGLIREASYNQLYGITINSAKTNLFVCDLNRIRQIGYNINAITGNTAAQINAATQQEAATRYCVTLLDSNPNLPVFKNLVIDTNQKIYIIAVNGVVYKYIPVSEVLSVIATLPSGAGYGITIDSSNNLYVTDGVSSVFQITPSSNPVQVNLLASYLQQPSAITINSAGTFLYVSCKAIVLKISTSAQVQTFTQTGIIPNGVDQTWTCPAGVTSIAVTLLGAAGGGYADTYNGSPGATVSGFLTVVPTHVYTFIVGQGGYNAGSWWTGAGQGGYGGGGSGGGQYVGSGGGGRSAIQYTAGIDLVTAGGGGGSTNATQGGVGDGKNSGGTGTYVGANGSAGGGGGYSGGFAGKGGTSYYTDPTFTATVHTAGTAGNSVHINPGDPSGNGKIIIATNVSVIAGTGIPGYQDGIGLQAKFDSLISGIIIDDAANNLYLTEYYNQTVRKISLTSGYVITEAGKYNVSGSANGIGTSAQFNNPADIKADFNGNLYISDYLNNIIRKIDINSQITTSLAGNGIFNYYPATQNPDGILNQMTLFGPTGLAFDNPAKDYTKDLYLIDGQGKLLRSFFATYISSLSSMSTIVGYDFITMNANKITANNITVASAVYTPQIINQYSNTKQSYDTTFGLNYFAEKAIFLTSASNALLDAIAQSNIAVRASTIMSYDYLSIATISTTAHFNSISFNANQYDSNISNLLQDIKNQSTNIYSAYTAITTDALTASDALLGAQTLQNLTGTQVTFQYTGANQTFRVPSGVTSLTVELFGAGGSTAFTGGTNPEAQGGFVYGNLLVSPGQIYTIIVGGQTNQAGPQFGGGGAGGGGFGGSGGGYSGIFSADNSVFVIAGGGGGDAQNTAGGAGGGNQADPGYGGAGGGNQATGGTGSGVGATSGTQFTGGTGVNGGGGGGGGYYGGGGGGTNTSAGGGGSSYVGFLVGTIINTKGGGSYSPYAASQNGGTGHGSIKITYTVSGGGGGGFSPLSLPGCSFWFDASDAASVVGSPNLKLWKNKGQTGGQAIPSGGIPQNNTVAINGLNALQFGTGTSMAIQSALGGTEGNITFFCLTRVTSDIVNGPNRVVNLFQSPTGFGFGEALAYNTGTDRYELFAYTNAYNVWNTQSFAPIGSGLGTGSGPPA